MAFTYAPPPPLLDFHRAAGYRLRERRSDAERRRLRLRRQQGWLGRRRFRRRHWERRRSDPGGSSSGVATGTGVHEPADAG